jgi:hypothetical protein
MEIFDSESQVIEQRISSDKLTKYKGTALVLIAHLHFPFPCRQVDKKVVDQLKRDFEGEGGIKDLPINRVPAIIDQSILQAGLNKLATSPEAFRATSRDNPPRLHLARDVKLECLHGQHRILAAKEYLPPSKRWWAVDLYSTGLFN